MKALATFECNAVVKS